MAEIFPFRAWRYDPRKVRPADVVTQPYDKISEPMRERYLTASPYNFIHVEKGVARPGDSATNNVYTRAASSLDEWMRQGVLMHDVEPSFYPYFQEYTVPGTGQRRTRKGFIALGRLEDYAANVVFRHERTLPGPKADRLELLRHTRTQTGLLFLLYQDPERTIERAVSEAAQREPIVELTDENGVIHRLWALSGPDAIAAIAGRMADRQLVIADGHHRYETALAYRDECRRAAGSVDPTAPSEKGMMALFDAEGEGLTILPTHRLISGLEGFDFEAFRARLAETFDWYAYTFGSTAERETALAEFQHDMEKRGKMRPAIGAYAGGGAFYLLLPRNSVDVDRRLKDLAPEERRLDVVLLHRVILERGLGITQDEVSGEERIGYERDAEAAFAAVDAGSAQVALLLNPTPISQVTEAAFAGRVLPEKSTDFYPKLLSGLTLYRLDG